MRLLVDTHVLLWAIDSPEKLSAAARGALLAEDNAVSVSTASLWEVAIKLSLGRITLDPDWFARIEAGRVRIGARWLSVEASHCREVAVLPWHHRDPFDRLLVAQAMYEDMTLVSRDRVLADYPAPVLW